MLQPLSFVALYWFVFTFMIPGGRLGSGSGNAYIYFLISGLLPWLGFNEGLSRATTSIVESSAIVRKLPLRSEVLVIVPNATALVFQCIGLTFFIIALAARGMSLRQLWILPFAVVLQFLLQLGIGFFLATTYVFFRDVPHIITFVLAIGFYLSPILYGVSGKFEKYFFWNPLTPLLGLFRSAMLASPLPDGGSIVYLVTVAAFVCAAGLLFYRRAQPSLVDVI
ncbi:MAG: lipopolysaccharide transport system permease protein [Acidobacteriota bacterium]|nr:lipopolysaccharide transport system permease protein [Acidobacteriota bacterium]